jgi:hypothetical protein
MIGHAGRVGDVRLAPGSTALATNRYPSTPEAVTPVPWLLDGPPAAPPLAVGPMTVGERAIARVAAADLGIAVIGPAAKMPGI